MAKSGANPIEVMAKAGYEASGLSKWSDLTKNHQDRIRNSWRAALLALSDCDLPEEVFDYAAKLAEETAGESSGRHIIEAFRAILKKLSENNS